jgi:hypothetical protein
MNTPTHTTTVDELFAIAMQRDVPCTTIALQRNGIIIGGLIVVTGEKNYETIKSLLPKKPTP